MSGIDKKQVEDFFSKAAVTHQNENAVLDVAIGQEHSNIYRNYFTANYILKNLHPEPNETILDFGCGVGRIAKKLSPLSKKIVGVDSNAAMIETAKQKFAASNIEYYLLHDFKIPTEISQFDAAFSHWVFQHINDEESVLWLNELKRTLKPTGKILLFEQVKNETRESDKHLFRSTAHYNNLFEKAELKLTASFQVMRVPARGMSVWNKLPSLKILLPLVSAIDQLTLNRKPELADYFTYCFVLSK